MDDPRLTAPEDSGPAEPSTDLERQLIDVASQYVTPEALHAIALIHEAIGWACPAHSEGQYCCLDLVLETWYQAHPYTGSEQHG
jgi:hypothetical protein